MATATLTLGSQNRWLADGSTTIWNFNFVGGYLASDTVLAYSFLTDEAVRIDHTLEFLSEFQVRITPAVADGRTLVIYRDSSNGGLPRADFTDGGGITESNLDLMAKQSVFVSEEVRDFIGITTEADLASALLATSNNAAAAAVSAASANVSADIATVAAASSQAYAALASTHRTAAEIAAANAAGEVDLLETALAGTSSGQGASKVGMEDGGTVAKALKYRINVTAMPGFSAAAALPAFQAAITTLTALGGGTIVCPPLDYVLAVAAESDCLTHTVPIWYDVAQGATFSFGYYALPLFVWVGVDGGGMNGGELIFTGTRPGTSAGLTNNHFGYNATTESPPNFAAFICVLGSNNTRIDGVSWRGATTANNKEGGILYSGGTSSGPSLGGGTLALPGAGAVYNYGNVCTNVTSNDVFFGIAHNLQDNLLINNVYSDRYKENGFVGAGHVIYATGKCKNSRILNIHDAGTAIDAVTSSAAATLNMRSPVHCTIDGVHSARQQGLMGLLNDTQDSLFQNMLWSADRTADEAAMSNTAVIAFGVDANGGTFTRNVVRNIGIIDKTNSGLGRSSNCPIMSNPGGNVSTSVTDNDIDVSLIFAPDASNSRAHFITNGQRSKYKFSLTNNGTGTAKNLLQLVGSAAALLDKNEVHFHLKGNITTYDVSLTNSNGTNDIYVHGVGQINNRAVATGLAAGDRLIPDASMYSVRADLCNSIVADTYAQTFTGAGTIPAPLQMYAGRRIRYQLKQNTAAAVIAWNAVYKKQADGAAGAATTGVWEFISDGVNMYQVGGAVAYN